MATKIKENSVVDRVPPIKIKDDRDGKEYELDFSRESIVFAESRGFEIDNVLKYPVTYFPEIFFLAFRKNYGPGKGNISRTKTDELYERLGGMAPAFLERLINLYNQAALSNNAVETIEEMGKNGGLTVEL